MLSAFIPSEHSYPAVPLVGQLVHQRFVNLGPLVLEIAPLKFPRLLQIGVRTVSRMFPRLFPNGMDYVFTLLLTGANV